jgi:hypothetical protein
MARQSTVGAKAKDRASNLFAILTNMVIWLVLMGASSNVLSAEIKCRFTWGGTPPNNRCYEANLTGEIVEGDAERVREFLLNERQLSELRLVSPGGNLFEAMKIARIVRDALLETTTDSFDEKSPSNDECNSACAIIAFGGVSRRLGNIGLHRPSSLRKTEITFEQAKSDYETLIRELESFFTEMAPPRSLLDRMLTVGPEGIDRIYYPKEDIRRVVPDYYAPFQEWLHSSCKDADKYYVCMSEERHKEILRRAGAHTSDQ